MRRPARRMLALALVLEGVDRKTAAPADAQGLGAPLQRGWACRPLELPGRGAPAGFFDPGQVAELVSWLEAGPDPTTPSVAGHLRPLRGAQE